MFQLSQDDYEYGIESELDIPFRQQSKWLMIPCATRDGPYDVYLYDVLDLGFFIDMDVWDFSLGWWLLWRGWCDDELLDDPCPNEYLLA